MIGLAHPAALLLLVPPATAWLVARRRRARLPAVRFSGMALLASQPASRAERMMAWLGASRAVAVALTVLALARPQSGTVEERILREGIDVVVALDISSSMLARDFEPLDRIAVAKDVVGRFLAGRDGDRVGLVVFAAHAMTKAPLVLDTDVVAGLVEDVRVGEIEDGTAIGSAIATSLNRLKVGEGTSRVLVLVTDGVSNRGSLDPRTAARLAVPLGVRIHTVGVGTRGQAPYPVRDALGRVRMVPVAVELDEATLTDVAEVTGGKYFRATDADALARIFAEIDQLEPSSAEVERVVSHRELFPWLLVPAVVLVAAATWLERGRLRVLP